MSNVDGSLLLGHSSPLSLDQAWCMRGVRSYERHFGHLATTHGGAEPDLAVQFGHILRAGLPCIWRSLTRAERQVLNRAGSA